MLANDPSPPGEWIYQRLCERFGAARIPSRSTIHRRVRQMKSNLGPLDRPFEWHLLESAGLPWEASSILLTMWAYFSERDNAIVGSGVPSEWLQKPTMRKARWWWRVHQALPDLLPENNRMNRIETIAFFGEWLWLAEFSSDVLGKPMDISGIQAWLAYKPWNEQNIEIYERAIEEGRIPAISGLAIYSDRPSGLIESIETDVEVRRGQ